MVSCGKENPYLMDDLAQESFTAWMTKNDPAAQPFVGADGAVNPHIYVRFAERGPVPADSQKLVDYAWFYTSYTGYTLDGTIFVTRDSSQSRLIGKWKNSTHWVDDFLQVYSSSSSLSPGLYKVVQTLRPGDSVRIYLEGKEAYNVAAMSFNSGYTGEVSTYVNFPIYFDMRIKSVLHTPAWAEQDTINKYAAQKWNLKIQDTIRTGLYMNIIKSRPKNDPITKDTLIQINYTTRFLDGFYITSTSDSIARSEKRYNPASAENPSGDVYGVMRIQPNENSGLPKALYECLIKMRKGESAEIISTSRWTSQGNQGSFSNTPQIMSYQPLKYIVEIADTVSTNI